MNSILKNLESAYDDFIKDFADPKSLVKSVVEDKIKCKIEDVFNTQKQIDYAKSVYGKKGLKAVIALYLSHFQGKTGINHHGLDVAIKRNNKHLLRHLGPDKVQFLKLMALLLLDLEKEALGAQTKRGLIYAVRDNG